MKPADCGGEAGEKVLKAVSYQCPIKATRGSTS